MVLRETSQRFSFLKYRYTLYPRKNVNAPPTAPIPMTVLADSPIAEGKALFLAIGTEKLNDPGDGPFRARRAPANTTHQKFEVEDMGIRLRINPRRTPNRLEALYKSGRALPRYPHNTRSWSRQWRKGGKYSGAVQFGWASFR